METYLLQMLEFSKSGSLRPFVGAAINNLIDWSVLVSSDVGVSVFVNLY